jgi:hypothetical protein
MKLFAFLAALVAVSGQDLSAVKTVYMLPMSGGLDQYLAVRLTSGHIFQVVTDPLKADAVFTDRLGAGFEQTLRELYAGEKPPEEKPADDFTAPAMAPLTRARGSFFLVDHKTHNVVWSIFVQRKNNDASELNRLAGKIATQLEKDLNPKK